MSPRILLSRTFRALGIIQQVLHMGDPLLERTEMSQFPDELELSTKSAEEQDNGRTLYITQRLYMFRASNNFDER